jgi:hypothetical protein
MQTDNNEPEKTIIFPCRESPLKVNAELIANLQKRVNVKRFRPQERDSVKLGYIRALIQALQVQNAILKDIELDAIKQELEEVRELVKISHVNMAGNFEKQ